MRYKKADKYIVFNEDPDLTTITIELPSPPPKKQIINYGLPYKKQKFFRPEIPKKLKDINKNKKLSIVQKAEILKKDPEYYAEEIEFIQQEWDRRYNGVWYYINGKPTYIPGVFYFYLTTWFVDNKDNEGFADYRDRDRKFFIFAEYCEYDENCYGFIYPKHRREGATSKASCWNYEYISRNRDSRGGIQSKTEDDAEMVFQDHVIKSWRKLPFWFVPVFEGSTNPKSELNMNAPAIKVTASNMGTGEIDSIESSIDFQASGILGYDGARLERYHGDEIGKTKLINVYERHLVVRECMSKLNKIIGKAIYTSTAGEMTKGGGAQFKYMIEASNTSEEKRDGNGRTISGLYPLFIPATEGFIMDEFGMSLEKESLKFLQNERKQALLDGDYKKLNNSTRQYPIRLRDCFRNASAQDNFNMKIIQDQIDKYQFGNKDITIGDFEWENGKKDGRVIFVPRENGKFKVSYLFPNAKIQSNRFLMDGDLKIPANTNKFMGGADTFKFKTTQSGKKSSGGGAIFMKRDYTIDTDTRPMEDWETNRFICTYLHRPPSKDKYCEDMLMMSVYYGCRMCPEINIPAIMDHFERRGYNGYLHRVFDKKTGKYKKNPGYNTGVEIRESMFRAYQEYIEYHGYRLVHDDLLEQLLEIDEDMGDFDLFVAGGLCLIAVEDEQNFNFGDDTDEEGDEYDNYYEPRYI